MNIEKIVKLQAEPEPLEIDLNRFALLVIDMQNAFVSKGGMFDLWGFDISHIPNVNVKQCFGWIATTNQLIQVL